MLVTLDNGKVLDSGRGDISEASLDAQLGSLTSPSRFVIPELTLWVPTHILTDSDIGASLTLNADGKDIFVGKIQTDGIKRYSDRTRVIAESSVNVKSIRYRNLTSQPIRELASEIALNNLESTEYDFTSWAAARSIFNAEARVINPTRIIDILGKIAFEDFRDLSLDVIGGVNKLVAHDRFVSTATKDSAPVLNRPIDPIIETDDFSTLCNRAILIHPRHTQIYSNTPSQTKYGISEQRVHLNYLTVPQLGVWSAIFFYRFSNLPVWMEVSAQGYWSPGLIFKAAFPETLSSGPPRDADGDFYQVRRVEYDAVNNISHIKAWKVLNVLAATPTTLVPDEDIETIGAETIDQTLYYAATTDIEADLPKLDDQDEYDITNIEYKPSPIDTQSRFITPTVDFPFTWKLTRTFSLDPDFATPWVWDSFTALADQRPIFPPLQLAEGRL